MILPAATASENPLTLLPNATVHKVLLGTDGQAEGIEFSTGKRWERSGIVDDFYGWNIPQGRVVRVRAKNVLLSAGTLGSTVVLKNSGIANKNVGKGLAIQPALHVTGFFDRPVNMHSDENWGVVNLDYRADRPAGVSGFLLMASRYLYTHILSLMPGSKEQTLRFVKNVTRTSSTRINLTEPSRPENRIEVEDGKPVVRYTLSDEDRRGFAFAASEAAKNLLAAGAKGVFLQSDAMRFEDETGLGVRLITNARQAEALRRMPIQVHQAGLNATQLMSVNKMGDDPATSVVDRDHRVWGTKGLYVVDSSVFKEPIGGLPMHAIYVMARLFVEKILNR